MFFLFLICFGNCPDFVLGDFVGKFKKNRNRLDKLMNFNEISEHLRTNEKINENSKYSFFQNKTKNVNNINNDTTTRKTIF